MFWFLLYVVTQVVLLGAWVSGTLDPYQKRLQEIVLYMMGETKASYGLKSKFEHRHIVIRFVRAGVLIRDIRESDCQDYRRRHEFEQAPGSAGQRNWRSIQQGWCWRRSWIGLEQGTVKHLDPLTMNDWGALEGVFECIPLHELFHCISIQI